MTLVIKKPIGGNIVFRKNYVPDPFNISLAISSDATEPITNAMLSAAPGILRLIASPGATVNVTISSTAVGSRPIVIGATGAGGLQSLLVSSTDLNILDGTDVASGIYTATVSAKGVNESGDIFLETAPFNFSYSPVPSVTTIGDLSVARIQHGSEAGPIPSIFRFTRTGNNSQALTIQYSIFGGTAIVDVDYVIPTLVEDGGNRGAVTFAPGSSTVDLSIDTIDNNVFLSSSRTLTIALVATANYTIGSPASATLVENDARSPSKISISPTTSIAEGTGSNLVVTIRLFLDTVSTVTISVQYNFGDNLANGTLATAVSGEDYIGTSGTATWNPGTLQQIITFTLIADSEIELDEFFFLNLFNPVNANFSDGGVNSSSRITLVNDDFDPPLGSGVGITFAASEPSSVVGGEGNDTLGGSGGADSFTGGNGDDVLIGGGGADNISATGGGDRYVYLAYSDSTRSSLDSVTGFSLLSNDRIVLNSPILMPTKLWHMGIVNALSLDRALDFVYADVDVVTNTTRPLGRGEAVIFSWGNSLATRNPYVLLRNTDPTATSYEDLLIRVPGIRFTTVGELDPRIMFQQGEVTAP